MQRWCVSTLGLPSSQTIDDIISSLQSGNLSAPVVTLQQLYDSGLRASSIASGLAARLRTDLAADTPTLSASDALAAGPASAGR